MGNLVSQTTTGAYDLALAYTYDLSGRMTSESRTENGATLESVFTYDPLGQLTGFTRSDGQSESYAYDPVGNMTAKTRNGVQTAMGYNAANQLIQSVTGNDTTKYTYDASGNLVRSENAGGARSYAYNALNLLQSFTREDGYTETYTYNANRLLSSITTSEDLTTALTWDILYGDGVVIAESQNGQSTNYTYGLERISAQTGNTRTEYVYDGRGSVAGEVSYNNAWYTLGGLLAKKTVTAKSYTPFGEQIGEAVSGFGYNGEYYNAATGMIYLRARFYAPEMNRFGQKDLVRGSAFAPQSLNRYVYCWNDPVDYIDPSGELGILAITAIASVVTGLAAGAVSAYESYKTSGEIDWKQAGRAAVGGAVSAAAVGLSIATGGMGLGLATLAVEAVAGGRTALRGGNSADVATSMANAGAAAAVAGSLMPVLPATVKVGLGAAGVAGSGIKLNNDLKTAKETFSNPSSTAADKLTSALDVAIDGAALIGSAALIGQNLKPAANELGQVYNGAKQIAGSIKQAVTSKESPVVGSTQTNGQKACCGDGLPWGNWEDYEHITAEGPNGSQEYAKIGDRLYSRHAVERMQPSGNRYGSNIYQASSASSDNYGRSVAPAYVEYVIQNGVPTSQANGNVSYVLGTLEVITNSDGSVVTMITH